MSGFTHEAPSAGATNEWYTPPWVFQALGLNFDLDPCSPVGKVLEWVPAAKRYTVLDNGLRQPWSGSVWCNPPYGPDTRVWLQKMADHRNGIALVFARCDTGWFHDTAKSADALFFFRKRVRFVASSGKDGAQPAAGSMLFAWGERHVSALDRLASLGHGLFVMTPRQASPVQPGLALGVAP